MLLKILSKSLLKDFIIGLLRRLLNKAFKDFHPKIHKKTSPKIPKTFQTTSNQPLISKSSISKPSIFTNFKDQKTRKTFVEKKSYPFTHPLLLLKLGQFFKHDLENDVTKTAIPMHYYQIFSLEGFSDKKGY
jgi:hypothetical protein